jgi:hypothetical protein
MYNTKHRVKDYGGTIVRSRNLINGVNVFIPGKRVWNGQSNAVRANEGSCYKFGSVQNGESSPLDFFIDSHIPLKKPADDVGNSGKDWVHGKEKWNWKWAMPSDSGSPPPTTAAATNS